MPAPDREEFCRIERFGDEVFAMAGDLRLIKSPLVGWGEIQDKINAAHSAAVALAVERAREEQGEMDAKIAEDFRLENYKGCGCHLRIADAIRHPPAGEKLNG
jgi:hypothetical protein